MNQIFTADSTQKQLERAEWLIEWLLQEMPEYRSQACQFPHELPFQKQLLRSLMNVRPPAKLNPQFVQVQDAYLKQETQNKGIVHVNRIPPSPVDERLCLWRGDITRLDADGIVNAANSALLGCFVPCHGCIDNAIHSAAGLQLRQACAALMNPHQAQPTGSARITPAFNLPSRYVLHTVGPIVHGRLTQKHCRQLAECYRSCLELADQNGLQSLVFCCISTGEFHFPRQAAAEIAVQTVTDYFKRVPDSGLGKVVFDVFDQQDEEIYRKLLGGPQSAEAGA